MKNYGLPYIGSKSRIAEWVINNCPQSDCFVDVFFGGGAATHAAIESGKYKRFIANDLRETPQCFVNAMNGIYKNRYEWVDREPFFKCKDKDIFIGLVWSFGNDGKSYLYGKHLENYKKAVHLAVCFDEWALLSELTPEIHDYVKNNTNGENVQERRISMTKAICDIIKFLGDENDAIINKNAFYNERFRLKTSLLQNLERLQRIHNLERLQTKIEISNTDYRNLVIPNNSIVYCDPPYKDSAESYGVNFDHKAFYDWCVETSKKHIVIISEYNIKDERFTLIGEKEKIVSASATSTCKKIEKLYKVK